MGGFFHAPYEPGSLVRLEGLGPEKIRALLVAEASAETREAAVYRGREDPGAEPLGSTEWGQALLFQGRVSEAVTVLESVAHARPGDPTAANDLSVALLERAAREARPADLARALAEAERAMALSQGLPEPAFNRALALDALYLNSAAKRAWQEYLEADPDSAWANEAAGRIRSISGAELRHTQVVGESGLEPSLEGPAGLAELKEGIGLYEQQQVEEAFSRLRRAESLLSGRAEPAALEARLYLALCHYQKAEYERAATLLEKLVERASASEDLVGLAGRSYQVVGLIHQIQGRRGEALVAYQAAADALQRAGDRRRWAGVQVVLAELFKKLGNSGRAWEHRYLALAEGPYLDPYGRSRLYAEASSAMMQDGELPAARYFLEAMAGAAEASGNLTAVAAVHRRLGLLAYREGRIDQALGHLDEAEVWARRIPDASSSQMGRGDVLLARAEVLAEAAPKAALADLVRVRRIFAETSFDTILPRVLLQQARAHRRLGQGLEAKLELDAALRAVEDLGSLLGDAATAGEFFSELARPIFDEAIRLAVEDLDDPLRAFELAGRALDTANREVGAGSEAGPLLAIRVADVQETMGPSIQLIQYYALEDRLLGWAVDQTTVRFFDLALSNQERQRLATELRSALLGASQREMARVSSDLRERVLGPFEEFLQPGADLLVIPDGFLHAVPFNLLLNAETGRYLVEDHPITVLAGPASSMDVQRGATTSARRPLRRVLIVADPLVEAGVFTPPALPGARREAESVASGFPEAKLLMGAEATRSSFLAWAPTYEVVHFAGHAVSNSRTPLLSYLLLAPNSLEAEAGPIFAEELVSRDLDAVRLVVLSACSSAGPADSTAGVTSLARAFLAAGVSDVVGSLWPVEDSATEELVVRFYEGLRSGLAPSRALRGAQLDMLRSAERELRSPAAWAGFQVLSSQAEEEFEQNGN